MKPEGTYSLENHHVVPTPIVVWGGDSLQKARYLVRNWNLECQWYHRIHKEFQNELLIYRISDFFLPPQECKATEIDSTGGNLRQMWQDIKATRGLDTPELGDLMKDTSVWCHSHVNMQAKPSGTDDTQWAEQKKQSARASVPQPQAMIILNKSDDFYMRIYDPELNVTFTNPKIVVDYNLDLEALDKDMEKYLTIWKPPVPPPSTVIGSAAHHIGYGQRAANVGTNPNFRQPGNPPGNTSNAGSSPSKDSSSSTTSSVDYSGPSLRSQIFTGTGGEWKKRVVAAVDIKLEKEEVTKMNNLVKNINKSARHAAHKEIDSLIDLLSGHLGDDVENWYTLVHLTDNDLIKLVPGVLDRYTQPKTAFPSPGTVHSWRHDFRKLMNESQVEPYEKVIQALQLILWLQQFRSDIEVVSNLTDIWIETYVKPELVTSTLSTTRKWQTGILSDEYTNQFL